MVMVISCVAVWLRPSGYVRVKTEVEALGPRTGGAVSAATEPRVLASADTVMVTIETAADALMVSSVGTVGRVSVGTVGSVSVGTVGSVSVGVVGKVSVGTVGSVSVGSVSSAVGTPTVTVTTETADVEMRVGSVGTVGSVSVGNVSVGTVGSVGAGTVGSVSVGTVGSVGSVSVGSVNSAVGTSTVTFVTVTVRSPELLSGL
jgi:hypothetical protein